MVSKGNIPWNKGTKGIMKPNITSFKKGQHISTKTEFKKGLAPWTKGKHPSKETIKKQSESWRKTFLSNPEVRKRMSESHKGQIAWNKSLKGIMPTPWNKGKKGVQIAWNKGKSPSEESKRKMSLSHKSHPSKFAFQKGCIPWTKGKHHSEEHRNKISEAKKGHLVSEEAKRKMSESSKKVWSTPKYKQIAKERRATQIFPLKDSKPEIKIQNFLQQLGITFLKHKHIKEIVHSYQCDIFIPSMNLIIECDGNYWHKYPIGREIDHIRTKELIDKGFRVLRLWESDIKKMNLKDFMERIKPFNTGFLKFFS